MQNWRYVTGLAALTLTISIVWLRPTWRTTITGNLARLMGVSRVLVVQQVGQAAGEGLVVVVEQEPIPAQPHRNGRI